MQAVKRQPAGKSLCRIKPECENKIKSAQTEIRAQKRKFRFVAQQNQIKIRVFLL